MIRHDVAIVGSGMAGSILARTLVRQGLRVALVEKGRHPRFALGESSTPLAGFALERLAARYDLPDLHQLSTWGRWLRDLPHLRRGLKRGFTFYQHRPGEPFANGSGNEARLLVAASPEDAIADAHWLRSDVDAHLAARAVEEGVDLWDETELTGLAVRAEGARFTGHRRGRAMELEAGFLVDASGPGGFLARRLDLPAAIAELPFASGLLYGHFQPVGDFVALARGDGAVLEPGPYPDEKAAVHHLLAEGWMYVLPFDHGVVSAGLVLVGEAAARAGERPPEEAFRAVLARYPTLARQFAGARAVEPVRYLPRMQHRLARAAGRGWCLLPHAYAFFDPIFSTGMAWSLLAVERLAFDLASGRPWEPEVYAGTLAREADQVQRLVETAYRTLHRFDLFVPVTFLYFAAVSFEEARQRLLTEDPASPEFQAPAFLGADDPVLAGLFRETLERLRRMAGREAGPQEAEAFARWMAEAIAPRNVAGLADPARRNLYPADLDLLVERAPLLGLTPEEVRAALPRLRGEGGGAVTAALR